MTAEADGPAWRTRLTYKNHLFYADEPVHDGGTDSAPAPGPLLMASLASCTLITIQMYAKRKEIDVTGLKVEVRYFSEAVGSSKKTRFEKRITFPAGLEESFRKRLLQVSEACPISKILNGEITTETIESI